MNWTLETGISFIKWRRNSEWGIVAQSFMNNGGRAVANVKSPLQRKLEKILAQRFPPPATVRLDDHDGIIGVITSSQFARMEPIDRQALIGDVLATNLKPEERRRVQLIVAVTPDEGTGYLAGPD